MYHIICVICLISKKRETRSSLRKTCIKIKYKVHSFLSITKHLQRFGYMWFLHILLKV